MPTHKAKSIPGVIEIMRLTWRNIAPRYWHLFFVYLVGILLCLFPSILQLRGNETASVLYLQNGLTEMSPLSIILWILLVFVSLILGSWVKVALRYAVSQKKNLPILQTYKKSGGILLKYIWVTFLVFIVSLPGFLLFLIPGFILTFFFWFADWFVITGEAKGLNALVMSRELLRGIFWKALWRAAAPWFISGLLSVILVIVLLVAWVVFYGYNKVAFPWVYTFAFTSVSVVFMPLLFGYEYELYSILKKHTGEIVIKPKQRKKYKVLAIVGTILFVLWIGSEILLFRYLDDSVQNTPTEETSY